MIHEYQIIFGDTDQMGVVYYANYLRFFEGSRAAYWRACGRTHKDLDDWGVALPVVEAQCRYRKPARYDDDLEVRTTGELLSPVRVQFSYEVVRAADSATLATGTTVHATLDSSGRPCRLPNRVRTLFT